MNTNMTDNYNENKWDKFEISGKVSDYLDYKGITTKSFSNVKGEHSDADNNSGTGGFRA